jgi:hypothetical protein
MGQLFTRVHNVILTAKANEEQEIVGLSHTVIYLYSVRTKEVQKNTVFFWLKYLLHPIVCSNVSN